MTEIRGRVWKGGKPVDGDFDLPDISDYLADDSALVWADVYDPDHDALAALAEELGLNSWAVEDALAAAERTKATVYKTHTFFTVYAVQMTQPAEDDDSSISMHRISGFVLPRGLITVRLSPWFDIEEVSQRFDELGGQEYGVGSLVHGLLDVVVDGHFEAVRSSMTASRLSRTRCSRTDPGMPLPRKHLSSCARTSSNCAAWCCRCARSSTPFSTDGSTIRRPRSSTRSTPTSTTTCYAPRNGPSRCAT